MRTWIACLLALGVLLDFTPATRAARHKTRAAATAQVAYVCASCGVGEAHSSACPVCKRPMAKVATYACLKCQISADAPGPCPSCHQPMKSLASVYRHCSTCGNYYLTSKKSCPVCKKHRKLARR